MGYTLFLVPVGTEFSCAKDLQLIGERAIVYVAAKDRRDDQQAAHRFFEMTPRPTIVTAQSANDPCLPKGGMDLLFCATFAYAMVDGDIVRVKSRTE